MNHTETITILGAGNMGASLVGGLIKNNYLPEKIWLADPDTNKLAELNHQFRVNTTTDNKAAIQAADIIILAIKPQIVSGVLTELASLIQQKKPLIISIAAGIREQTIQNALGGSIPIVRAMPNTPALVGCGATGLYANSFVSEFQHQLAENLLRSVSVTVWVTDEKLMDTITALSGSGPAYFFLVMEALQEAAVSAGLPEEMAKLLTLQTAYGAARMALESDVSPQELRKRVTSPGGTTEAALKIFEECNLREIYKKALLAAKKRSEELN